MPWQGRTAQTKRPRPITPAARRGKPEKQRSKEHETCKEDHHRRLQAAGYRLEGWDPRTGQRIAARITGENTNAERRTFYSFPTWQDAAAALLG